MTRPLEGIRVLEVAMWSFVPSAAVALAEWGAEVVKIEAPEGGDKLRGLVVSGVASANGLPFMFEVNNRGKRSVAVDVRHRDGRELVLRLASRCDVFLTSLLPAVRARLGLDVEDVRGRNPAIIYAIGSGGGREGPDRDRGGYDLASYWARSGVASAVTAPGTTHPANMPTAGFGDVTAGLALAGAISAALVGAARRGEGAVVDVSLLGTGLWSAQTEITATELLGTPRFFKRERDEGTNPLNAPYRTSDGRFVQLVMLEADRHWPDLCERIGRPDLVHDARFATAAARREHYDECVAALDAVFAARTLADWCAALDGATGVWAPVRRPSEVFDDAQVRANDYVQESASAEGVRYLGVSSPARFDDVAPEPRPAPTHGADTDDVLRTLLRIDDEELIDLKIAGVIL